MARTGGASDVGHELATQSGTFGLLWCIDKDNNCRCSLRSNGGYDVSAIAKAFGDYRARVTEAEAIGDTLRATVILVNELRAALVAKGVIKGAA